MIKKQNNSNRGEKIASAVQKHVAEILRDDYADDPVLSRVSVVGTDSAGGLQFARIWYQVMDNYSPLGGSRRDEIASVGGQNESQESPHRLANGSPAPPTGGAVALIQRRLNAALPAIRRELARRMNQRQVPELQFAYDDTIERGQRIDELLATADL